MSRATRGGLMVFCGAACFATEAIFVKFSYEFGLSPLTVTLSRLLIAFVVMGPVFLVYLRRHTIPRTTWWALALGGMIGHSGVMLLLATALQRISASVTILCLYLYPTVTTLLAVPVLGERITWQKLLALGGSLIGVALVAWVPGDAADFVGVALAIAAALVNGVQLVLVKRWLNELPPLVSSAGILCFSTIAYYIAGLTLGTSLAMPGPAFGYIVGLGLISTVTALALLYHGLSLIEASIASIISTSEPALTAILAAIFLGEVLAPRQLTGGALIIASTVLAAVAERYTKVAGE